MSMGVLWYVCGSVVVCLWECCGMSVVVLWYVYGSVVAVQPSPLCSQCVQRHQEGCPHVGCHCKQAPCHPT